VVRIRSAQRLYLLNENAYKIALLFNKAREEDRSDQALLRNDFWKDEPPMS
jgi:hypothetical protein